MSEFLLVNLTKLAAIGPFVNGSIYPMWPRMNTESINSPANTDTIEDYGSSQPTVASK
jgi:hypothetical protein